MGFYLSNKKNASKFKKNLLIKNAVCCTQLVENRSLIWNEFVCSFEHHKIQRRIEWAEYLIYMKVHIARFLIHLLVCLGRKLFHLSAKNAVNKRKLTCTVVFFSFCEHSKFEMIKDVNTFEKMNLSGPI